MGRGSRHSKNAGVMGTEALTYHERKAMGHGTLSERLGKDAQGNFYDCSLTLQPAKDPVITAQGHLFSKEAIMQFFLDQKKERKRQLSEWEAEEARHEQLEHKKNEVQQRADLVAFERHNVAAASDRTADAIAQQGAHDAQQVGGRAGDVETSGHAVKMNAERARTVKSFWQPQDTPDSAIRPDKPSMDVVCPVSGKKLRLKDLTPVKFTAAPDDSGSLFMDPLSKDMLTNSSTIVVLKPTGDAMLMTTYVQCVKPDGHYDGHKVREKDVIKLVGGGTGFAGKEGQKLQSDRKYMLGPGTGKADLRGQAAGGASKFGLSFQN